MTDAEPVSVHRHIAADHPAFAGHFPGQPVLPGVVLLAEVLEAVLGHSNRLMCDWAEPRGHGLVVDSVKFLAPVGPGTDLRIDLHVHAASIVFEVVALQADHADVLVARGQFKAGPGA